MRRDGKYLTIAVTLTSKLSKKQNLLKFENFAARTFEFIKYYCWKNLDLCVINELPFDIIQTIMLYPVYFCSIGYSCFMRLTKIFL